MRNYWGKQTGGKPLFPDLLWSRPENRAAAGKLLTVGGNVHGFAAVGEAYGESMKAGIGSARVLLPEALRKTVGNIFEAGEFAASNPSGSFARASLAELLEQASWADGVLIAGDLGRNSETAVVLEQFAEKYSGQLIITKDAVDYFTKSPQTILARAKTTFALSLAQLQQLARAAGFGHPITFGMNLLQLVEALHEFTETHPINLVVKHLDNIFVAVNGQVSTTKLYEPKEIWRVATAAHASVWWLQNPSKIFEALTTAIYEIAEPTARLDR